MKKFEKGMKGLTDRGEQYEILDDDFNGRMLGLVVHPERKGIYEFRLNGASSYDEQVRLIHPDDNPAKYSVDLWVSDKPELCFPSRSLDIKLFGEKISGWADLPVAGWRKVRVTVEEIE